MDGAKTFCAIRSYLTTAARHGIGAVDALTSAAEGNPWIPQPALQATLPVIRYRSRTKDYKTR
jgi:hypothetical protein